MIVKDIIHMRKFSPMSEKKKKRLEKRYICSFKQLKMET